MQILNNIDRMPEKLSHIFSISKNLKLILYIGLVLSQTQLLVNLKFYTNIYYFPKFTVAYFLISTLYLIYAFCSYAFLANRSHAFGLEIFEYICLPISVFLITLLTLTDGTAGYEILGVLLFSVQTLFVVLKVVYFGSLFQDLAHISILYKLSRIVKLKMIAVLPLFVSQQLIIVGVIGVCQIISTCIFFFKFTFQRLDYEYLLLIGVFSGVLSTSENIFEAVFGLKYLFFGELASLYYYVQPNCYLRNIIQIKYISICNSKSFGKSDDDNLAAFFFINQCLFPNKQTIWLSDNAKNQAIIQATALLDRLPAAVEDKNFSEEQIIQSQLISHNRPLLISLLQVYYSCFHEESGFAAFQFLINSALYLGGTYVNRALIIYYAQLQRISQKKSMFETCKYEYLYLRIRAFIEVKQNDRQQVKCIEFSNSLRELNSEIEECFNSQLKMVEYLIDNKGRQSFTTIDHLLRRNQLKSSIRARLDECFSKEIYFISNQFKFLFLLYETTIERRGQRLHELLRTHFLTSQVQKLRQQNKLKSMVVLSGFRHGEIVNSNEIFKNNFSITLNSFARNNISEFIPSQTQKMKHTQLMSQFIDFKLKKETSHSQLECWLLLQRQFNAIKLKIIQKFQIGVRVYYQYLSGFHYVCSLTLQGQTIGRTSLSLLKRDCEIIANKGVLFTLLGNKKVLQLGEEINLCEISFNQTFNKTHLTDHPKIWERRYAKEEENDNQGMFGDKMAIIEKKLIEEDTKNQCTYSLLNWVEIILFLASSVLLVLMFVSIHQNVDSLGIVVTEKQSPVIQAQLLRNRIIMQQQIISFLTQTPYFPSNICDNYGIPNLTDYTMKILNNDIINSTNEFLSLITMPNYGSLDDHLYVRQFTSPYLRNYPLNISFQKSISLLKTQIFTWLATVRNTSLNVNFYTQTFPNVLMSNSIGSSSVLSTLMDADQAAFSADLTQQISNYRVMTALILGLACIIMTFLRLCDNSNIIDYLRIVQKVKLGILQARMIELKSAIGQLHNLASNCIQGIDISSDLIISIHQEQGTQNIPLSDFADWHLENRDTYENKETQLVMEEYNHLLNYHEHEQGGGGQERQEEFSPLLRTLNYQKIYLILFLGLMVIMIFLVGNILQTQQDQVALINLCDNASSSVLQLQQTIMQMVSYNWIKVLSLYQPINMTLPNSMMNYSIYNIYFNPYQSRFSNAYSRQFSNSILNGDVCIYFNNPKACQKYRNGLFSNGFSMLVPYVLKQQLETGGISNNASYSIPNLCDKTWLFFEGVVPMSTQIPIVGYSTMIEAIDNQYFNKYIQLFTAAFLILIVTLVCQNCRINRERIIREEALSLDTAVSLYTMPQFKPYFNKIYYS